MPITANGLMRPAVAITGLGVVSAYGCDTQAFYDGVLSARGR